MKTFKVAFATLLVLGILMYFTNPDQVAFNAWMEQHIEERMDDGDEGLIGGAMNDIFSQLASAIGAQATERKEFYLFSVYEVDFGKTEYHYLGLFKTFIPLQSENPLDELPGLR